MLNAICPHCGEILVGDETPETEWTRGQYTDFVLGFCPKCEHRYIWHEVYTLSRIENITEVTEE